MTAKAQPLPDAANVPAQLRALEQWVAWRYVAKKGTTKPTKVPYQSSGYRADTTEPRTWTTFRKITEDVAKANGRFAGVGFVFSDTDPFCGIDLDNCLNQDGTVMDWAEPILARFADTYAEVSPSGSGLKIWCQASLTRGRKIEFRVDGVKCAVEAYSQSRFFTLTGRRWLNSPLDLRPHGPDIEMALEVAANLAKVAPAAAASSTASPSPVFEGGRHDAMKKMGIKLRMVGMDATMIEAALSVFNSKRCSPPKPELEVREIARWGGRASVR
jgi:putative DNA primase/helicase